MAPITRERRKVPRILFSKEDEIVASLSFQGTQKESLKAIIMNLGEGGMCVIFKKDAAVKLDEEDTLSLTEIKGISPELQVDELKMKVRWVMDEKFFEHIQLGCEFLNASDKLKKQIRQIEAAGTVLM